MSTECGRPGSTQDAIPLSRRLLSRLIVAFGTCGVAVGLVLLPGVSAAQLLLAVSDGADVYGEVANEIARRVRIGDSQLQIDVAGAQAAATMDAERLRRYRLVITIGAAAARALALPAATPRRRPPTLALLIPRNRIDEFVPHAAGERDGTFSAIFIEQPLARQLDLVALALPARTRVGVLLGPASAASVPELDEVARALQLDVRIAEARDATAVYPALQRVLLESDVLLALPDNLAVNAATIRSVLVASHRAQVPVIGFSQALVDAGALLAVYSTPQQYARQAAEIALRVLRAEGAVLPRPQYPRYFTVGVNFLAAHVIGLAVDDESTLAAQLAARAREREKERDREASRTAAKHADGSGSP